MTCWTRDARDPTDICNATAGQLLQFLAEQYPVLYAVLRYGLVASMVLSLGLAAAAVLVAWRRRMTEELERELVEREAAVDRARRERRPRPAVYPVRCPSAETVRLRRTPGGGLEPDEPTAWDEET